MEKTKVTTDETKPVITESKEVTKTELTDVEKAEKEFHKEFDELEADEVFESEW